MISNKIEVFRNENRMAILSFVVVAAFIVSCNSGKIDNDSATVTKEKDTTTKSNTSNIVDQKSDPSVIYDTLVFTANMNGELLNDKFVSGQPKLEFYKKFIIPKKINEGVVLKEKDVKTEIRYLGELNDLDNKATYHVITNFRVIGIGEMLSPRGKSEIAFVNKANDKIIVYDLPMPQNLPRYIKNNVLFFEYDNTRAGISISGGLPPLFCLPEIGCN